jgi:hypothetical protein
MHYEPFDMAIASRGSLQVRIVPRASCRRSGSRGYCMSSGTSVVVNNAAASSKQIMDHSRQVAQKSPAVERCQARPVRES